MRGSDEAGGCVLLTNRLPCPSNPGIMAAIRRRLALLAALLLALGSSMAVTGPVTARPDEQTVLPVGAVVTLAGTPHLWIVGEDGALHWAGDTRSLAGRNVDWSVRREMSVEELKQQQRGDPWLSAGLLKSGDPIYFVKWETEWPEPQLLHIQSIEDVELFGINSANYGVMVNEQGAWEGQFGIESGHLKKGSLPSATQTIVQTIILTVQAAIAATMSPMAGVASPTATSATSSANPTTTSGLVDEATLAIATAFSTATSRPAPTITPRPQLTATINAPSIVTTVVSSAPVIPTATSQTAPVRPTSTSKPPAPTPTARPSSTPKPATPTKTPFADKNCTDFHTWREAQDFFLANGGPTQDPHRLDVDHNGIACESLSGAPK
jgi:hypothetical protein